MEPARLCLEPSRTEGEHLTLAAQLEHPVCGRQRLWWQLPTAWAGAVTPWADPFVVGFLFPMMQWGRDVMVEGRVSPSLLTNLETFMAIWHAWMPDRYQPVSIRGQEEVEAPFPAEPGQTVIPFSCGVDSCFTLFRHRHGMMGRRNGNIRAGVVMNGFDIWLDQENASALYSGLLESARILLDSQAVACLPMVSNFHDLPTTWAHSFGTHLVSGLRLLGARFDSMMMPNNMPYSWLPRPWGSHPVSDPHLSSQSFRVADDGAEFHRPQKVHLLSKWPEAMRYLRVCFENPASHANCCRCEKCVRTILAFRAAGCPFPPAFAHDVTDRQIHRMRLRREVHVQYWRHVLLEADQRGLGNTSWARAVRTAIRRSRRRWVLDRFRRPFIPLRNFIRLLLRGSVLSRRQLAKRAAKAAQGPRSLS